MSMDGNCLFGIHIILIYYICIREAVYRRKPAERSRAKKGGSAHDNQNRFHSQAPCAGKSNSYCRISAGQLGIERVARGLLLDTPAPSFFRFVRAGARGQPCFQERAQVLKKTGGILPSGGCRRSAVQSNSLGVHAGRCPAQLYAGSAGLGLYVFCLRLHRGLGRAAGLLRRVLYPLPADDAPGCPKQLRIGSSPFSLMV